MKIRNILIISLPFAIMSCATPGSSPLSKLAARDVKTSADVGSFIGMGAGAIIGHNVDGLGIDAGAFWGSEAGRLIGQQIGEIAASRRLKYASEADFLDTEIAASKDAVLSKERGIVALRQDLKNIQSETSRLEAKKRSNLNVMSEAQRSLEQVESAIASNNKLIAEYEVAIQYINEVIANSRSASVKERGLESKRNALYAERNDLREQVKQLHGINNGNKAVKTRLTRLAGSSTSLGTSTRTHSSYNPLKNVVPSKINDAFGQIPFTR